VKLLKTKARFFSTPEGTTLGFPTAADCTAVTVDVKAVAKNVNALIHRAPARWERSFKSIQVLTREGAEVKRITADEGKAIFDDIEKYRALITKGQEEALTEAQEDLIDNDISNLIEKVAKYMSDVPRKLAAAAVTATPASTTTSTTTTAPTSAGSSGWIAIAATGATPSNAVEVASLDGKPLIQVCRAKGSDGNVRPGKAYKNNCYIFDNDKEIKVDAYEALVLPGTIWLAAAGGVSPAKAVEGSPAVAGSPVHICRTKLADNYMHSGMAYKGTCYVGYGGKGTKATTFEVLATK